MDRPFSVYNGDEPYVFVSYSHRDSAVVFPELIWLKEQGCNVWYDEGIEAGAEWREEIGRAIKNASSILYFISPESAQSENCRKEVSLADKEQIPILAVHLDKTDLPDGLDLTLSDRQAILRYELSDEDYYSKLLAGLGKYVSSGESFPQVVARPAVSSVRKFLLSFSIVVPLVLVAAFFYLKLSEESAIPDPVLSETTVAAGPVRIAVFVSQCPTGCPGDWSTADGALHH